MTEEGLKSNTRREDHNIKEMHHYLTWKREKNCFWFCITEMNQRKNCIGIWKQTLILWKSKFLDLRGIKALFLRFVFWKYFINVPLGIRTGEVREGESCAVGNVSPVVIGHFCPLLTACLFTLVHRVISLVSVESN